jgi:hypothetical protein
MCRYGEMHDPPCRVALSRVWGDWRSALAIVKPETVINWRRKAHQPFPYLGGADPAWDRRQSNAAGDKR